MDSIRKLRIKHEDGTYSNSIPIGASSDDIFMPGGGPLTDSMSDVEEAIIALDKTNDIQAESIDELVKSVSSNTIAIQNQKDVNEKQETKMENFEKALAQEKVYVFDNVHAMKNANNLKAGMYCITKGYYTPNDGGKGEYLIRTKTDSDVDDGGSIHELLNSLVAELIIEDNINVKQFGAYGDGKHDDTDAIQKAINYGYDIEIKNILVPAGEYNISKPLFLYDQIAIYGKNSDSSYIIKTTNTKSDIPNFARDAIFILINRDLTVNSSSSVQNVKINNICMKGNITKYIADKSNEDLQYAIIGVNNIPKAQISDFKILSVNVGIAARGCWTGWIKNCTWLQADYRAIYFSAETQGLNIANINTGSSHVCGIEVHGSAYSTISNVLVEWTYGGTAFIIGNWSGDILNCGTEVGSGVEKGFYFLNANARLTGAYISGNVPDSSVNNFMLALNNSTVEIDNSSIGYAIASQTYAGAFAYVGNHSHLKIGEGVNFNCSFRDDCNCNSGDNNTITYLGRTYNGNGTKSVTSLTERYTWFNSSELPYIDSKISPNPSIRNINIYQDYINTPYRTKNTNDASWASAYMKGDIGLFYNSLVTGKAAWICNRGNNSDIPTSEGTITLSESGVITMSSLTLENYEITGMRFYISCHIKGKNSGATAYITRIDMENNKIYYSGLEGTFEVGEQLFLDTNPFVRDGDYLYIPIILADQSINRPTQSVATGTMFFDTSLNKPIWYNGTKWVNYNGEEV